MEDKESRTEKATARKRSKAREDGQVAVSKEVISLLVLLATAATFYAVIAHAGSDLLAVTRDMLGKLDQMQRGGARSWLGMVTTAGGTFLIPVALAGVAAAVVGGVAQTGGLFTLKVLKPKLNFLNPLPKLKKLFFSKETAVNLFQSTGKVAVIVAFTVQMFISEMQALVQVGDKTPFEILAHVGWLIVLLGTRVLALLVVFAALDVVFTRRRHEENLKMTKQEVKDEARQHEADPQVRGQQRRRRQELLAKGMMGRVPKADVVVVNPTHYAVALQYDAAQMNAPQVTAKGKDGVAARIRDKARENRVPVVHNPPLTRRLFAEAELGGEVPGNLFGAVAEVLAYVYRLRGRTA